MRRQKKLEAEKERQMKVQLGLMPPPPPKGAFFFVLFHCFTCLLLEVIMLFICTRECIMAPW